MFHVLKHDTANTTVATTKRSHNNNIAQKILSYIDISKKYK